MLMIVVCLKDTATIQKSVMPKLLDECSKQLCLEKFDVTSDAIYFYQYMAMLMKPPGQYLDSLMKYIDQKLNSFVPKYLLEIKQVNQDDNFDQLLLKMKQCGEIEYLELLIEIGAQSCLEQRRFLCYLIFLVALCTQKPTSHQLMLSI